MPAKTHSREGEHELWFTLTQSSQYAANVDDEARSLQMGTAANPTFVTQKNAFSKSFRGANTEMQQRRDLPLGKC